MKFFPLPKSTKMKSTNMKFFPLPKSTKMFEVDA